MKPWRVNLRSTCMDLTALWIQHCLTSRSAFVQVVELAHYLPPFDRDCVRD